jgi:mono/diheme cytochrome c family protein
MTLINRLLIFVSLLIMLPSWSGGTEGHEGHEKNHWSAPAKEAGRKNPVAADKASLERGGKLFKTYCASCHGEKGKGDGTAGTGITPKPSDLTRMAKYHKDGDLAWKIAIGRGPMPGWKSTLTENQIWDLVNFIKKGI